MNEVLKADSLRANESLDNIGAGLSLTCAIHCIATPLLVALLPLVGMAFLISEEVHHLFIISTVALAFYSLLLGYRVHRKLKVFAVLILSFAVMVFALFHEEHDYHSVWLSFGAIGIAASHLLNKRLCRNLSRI